MKKRLSLMLLCMMATFMAWAQTVINGTVVSVEDGLPVIGATVKVKGTNKGAMTDAEGKFKLNVESGKPLVFSYIGMGTVERPAKNGMFVEMYPMHKEMDEVMVVAYGTAKKSAFTGSAAVLNSKDIAKVSDSNPLDALKGKMAGVQINNQTGAPGNATFSMRIRGISSIRAGSDPLVIMDGAPYDGDFNTINPNDIASMTVLKDAAAAALYGARGANGVLIITTKSGKENHATRIEVDAKWGGNSISTPNYDMISSPAGYYEMWHSALMNKAMYTDGKSQEAAYQWANANLINGDYGLRYNVYNVPEGQYMIGTNGKLNPNATLGNNRILGLNGQYYTITPDDWGKAALRNGLRQEYNVTASGRSDKSSFYASAGYLSNEGVVIKSNYKRFASRLKADYQLKPWLKVGANMNYTHYNSDYMDGDGDASTAGGLYNLARFSAPIYPLYLRDANGNIIRDEITGGPAYDYGNGKVLPMARPYHGDGNAIGDTYLNTNSYEGNNFGAVGTVEIRFLKDFTFTSINNVLVDEQRGTHLSNPWYGQMANYGGIVQKSHSRTYAQNYQQLLNWHHIYGKHDVEAMVGHEYYLRKTYGLSASRSKVFSIDNDELAGAITDNSMGSSMSEYNVEGWFGRAQYNYDTKYFASVSYRRDASSKFHPDHRWGNFWSMGGAWNIHKEAWFNAPWVSDLKIKASYGSQGNDNIDSYLYADRFSLENNNGEISLVPSNVKGNKDITWEKQGNFNAGVEFGLWNSRLTGQIEFFRRTTSDMLAYFSMPASSGYTGYYDNVGNMRNQGVEITLGGDIFRTRDFTWGLDLNFTYYRNKITSMPEENKTQTVDGVRGYSSGDRFYGEGIPMYTYYMFKYAGVDPETGEALYYKNVKDENGNITGRTTTNNSGDADQYLCGTALPKAYGGFSTNLAYKGFDLSVDFQYQIGGQVYDGTYASLMGNSKGSAMHADLLNAWTPENRNTDIPRYEVNNTSMATGSDRWLTNASYLSIQGINFGYTLPGKLTNKIGIHKLRVYLNGGNLWVFSHRKGMDPRQSITGANSGAYYSQMRTISGGVSVTL